MCSSVCVARMVDLTPSAPGCNVGGMCASVRVLLTNEQDFPGSVSAPVGAKEAKLSADA